MNLMQSISTCFGKYVTFSGRAQRSELWWFALFLFVGSLITGAIDGAIFGPSTMMVSGMEFSYSSGFIGGAFSLAVFLPALAVEVRRLHDIGKSGWWLLIALIPVIGIVILLVWLISKGNEGDNKYGPDPLA